MREFIDLAGQKFSRLTAIEKVKSGNAPIEGNGNTAVVASGSPKTFKDAFKQSMAYLKATQK